MFLTSHFYCYADSGCPLSLPRHVTPSTRFLIVLDLNGLLLKTEYVGSNTVRREELKSLGYPADERFVYFLRPGFHEFIDTLQAIFDVAIWTCVGSRKCMDIMKNVFRQDQVDKMRFVFNQEQVDNTGLRNPYGTFRDAPILLKRLSHVYKVDSTFDVHNTLLIDDSPYKAFANAKRTCLFAPAYSTKSGVEEDDFLLNLLLPVLQKLAFARDVRAFLYHNEPLWSRARQEEDKKRYGKVYTLLKNNIRDIAPTGSVDFPYNVLELSPYEISWDTKDLVTKLSPVNQLSNQTVVDVVFALGIKHNEELVKVPRKFLADVLRVRNTTSHFQNARLSKRACTRDRELDPLGEKKTCTNRDCETCSLYI